MKLAGSSLDTCTDCLPAGDRLCGDQILVLTSSLDLKLSTSSPPVSSNKDGFTVSRCKLPHTSSNELLGEIYWSL